MTWEVSYEAADEFSEVLFLNDSVGYLLGRSTCLKTTTGGQDWQAVEPESSCNFADMFFLDENRGFITGCNEFFKTCDGGESWERDKGISDLVTYANAIYFADNNLDGSSDPME
jgi:photosystem II stability/assembly factor-like uncharacterized protein